MNPSNRLNSWPLILGLLSGQAFAVGFGDITLTSRVGEPLRAEVGIFSSSRDTVDTACFSLAPLRESDLPVITSARLKLVRDSQGYRLIISGIAPVLDPVFVLALRAGCGIELQRDFVLIPPGPIAMAEAAPVTLETSRPLATATAVDGTVAKRGPGKEWMANRGDTLESIAEILVPEDFVQQRRMLAALKRGNPELVSAAFLEEGTPVYVPNLRKASAAPPRGSERQAHQRPALPLERPEAAPMPRPKPKPRAAPTSATVAAGGSDRLMLGAPPDDFKPGEKPSPSRENPPQVEERMQRMEKTVSLLNEEIARLNQALALTSEVLAAQQKLQAAQASQASRGALRETSLSVPAPVPLPESNPVNFNWIELLLSALGGGVIAAIAAHTLAARRKGALDGELPLTMRASRSPNHPESLLPAETATLPAEFGGGNSPAAKPESGLPPEPDDKSPSMEDLIEIMLSFGCVQEASHTLAEYIEKEEPDQLPSWLTLLDLYRRSNRPQEFWALARRIREKFNIQVPAWDGEAVKSGGPDALEQYPHIVEFLTRTWGQQKCLDYLQDLLKDNRSGERHGFPRDVVEEIVLLARVLEDGYSLRPA